MEFEIPDDLPELEDIPDDLPDLEDIPEQSEFLTTVQREMINLVETTYSNVDMTPDVAEAEELEKMLVFYLLDHPDLCRGNMDVKLPMVMFLTFNANGVKPKNCYNFYFESGMIRCNNSLNIHQEYSSLTLERDEIDDTISARICSFIQSIRMENTTILRSLSGLELDNYSNPF